MTREQSLENEYPGYGSLIVLSINLRANAGKHGDPVKKAETLRDHEGLMKIVRRKLGK